MTGLPPHIAQVIAGHRNINLGLSPGISRANDLK
jgi:hypothetical protein